MTGACCAVNDWPGGFQALWLPHWGIETVGQAGRVGKAFCLVLSCADEALGPVILRPPAVWSSE